MDFDGHRDVFTKSTFKGVVALAVSFSELPQFVLLGQALYSDCPYPGTNYAPRYKAGHLG